MCGSACWRVAGACVCLEKGGGGGVRGGEGLVWGPWDSDCPTIFVRLPTAALGPPRLLPRERAGVEQKSYSTNLETESPIYNQILQQEQIELHKLGQLIKTHSGVILDYNTDAINCTFPNSKFPFKLVEDIQLNGHYWDRSNKVYKYKIEYNKDRLKTSRMQQTQRTETFNDMRCYNWKLTYDVEDNDFKPLVDKIMKSDQSYFITGPGGSGKTSLLKQLQDVLSKQDKKYITLCPINLAALLVGGMTIHKFAAKLK